MQEIVPITQKGQEVLSGFTDSEEAFRQLTEFFLSEQPVAPSSKVTYRYQMKAFHAWLNGERLSIATAGTADVLRFEQYLKKTGHSDRTAASYMNIVRVFYRWRKTKFNGTVDITSSLKFKSGTKKYAKMHLTAEQGRALLSSTEDDRPPLRNRAMVGLMLIAGLRTIEVSRARVGDIEWYGEKRILRVRGKGKGENNTEDFVVLIDDAWLPIERYLNETRKEYTRDEPLFTTEGDGHRGGRMSTRTIQDICKRHLRAIGLDSHAYSAHSLRHTTAMQILDRGGNLYDVQRVLRHSSLDTTKIYEESFKDEKHVKDAPEAKLQGVFTYENAEIIEQ